MRGREMGVTRHRGGDSSSGARLGTRARVVVPESSADSSSDEERWCGASESPACDLESFLAACKDGAMSAQCNLSALSKHSEWALRCKHKLQEMFKKSRLLNSCYSTQEPGKGCIVQGNSQRSSSQQSTGVQTSPRLLSQTTQSGQAQHLMAIDSNADSPDLGVGPVSPSRIVLDPRRVLQMMSGPIEGCKTVLSPCSCSDDSCDSPCEEAERAEPLGPSRLPCSGLRNPQKKHLENTSKMCCADDDSNHSSCSSDEENAKMRAQHSASEEESPLVTYYCYRRH